MSPNITDHLAPNKVARFTGGFYLAYILASILATMLGQIGMGEAPQVYQAIVTNEGSFRLGPVIALITGFLFLVTAWGLYVLLRPVNKDLALLFLLLNAVGVAIQGASMLYLVSAMLQGDGGNHLQASSAISSTSPDSFPRLLGVLLMVDGVAVLIWFHQTLLLPDYPAVHTPGLAVSFIAEVGLASWLLVKGVKVNVRANIAAEPGPVTEELNPRR